MTESDIRTINALQQKLKMLEDHHQEMTPQQVNQVLTTITFDINGMGIRRTGYEAKRY